MTSNALTEHHYCEEGPDDPVKSHCKAFLCLDKLSISRFGFVERLLWVQVLDLSHNELQSVEGNKQFVFYIINVLLFLSTLKHIFILATKLSIMIA